MTIKKRVPLVCEERLATTMHHDAFMYGEISACSQVLWEPFRAPSGPEGMHAVFAHVIGPSWPPAGSSAR